MISYLNFSNWKESSVTKSLMQFIREELEGPKKSLPSWEDVENPNRLAYKMGLIDALEKILNITREDLEEDESEGN